MLLEINVVNVASCDNKKASNFTHLSSGKL